MIINGVSTLNVCQGEVGRKAMEAQSPLDTVQQICYNKENKTKEVKSMTEKEILGVDKILMGGQKFRNGFEYTVKSSLLCDILDKIKDCDLERAGDVFSFYNDLEKSISSISKKTKKDGYQVWVVANRTVKGIVIPTDKIIEEIAQYYDLHYVHTIDRNIVNKVMPSANSPTNEAGKTSSTMTVEHIVVLRKV